MNKSLISDAKAHVLGLYDTPPAENLAYHNADHADSVVKRINEIAAHYDVNDDDLLALNIAGWFHDTGHLYTSPSKHEEKSVEVADEWLAGQNVSQDIRNRVKAFIMATNIKAEPQDLPEKIIKDADTFNLGTKEFKTNDKLLRKEMRKRNFTTMLTDWSSNTLALLEDHQFYTEYCNRLLDEQKQKNITKLRRKESRPENTGQGILLTPADSNDKQAAKQNNFITKGIQTMLRLTSENHMRLSEMADSKANILISINAIIISLILSVLLRRIQVDTYLTIPTLVFLGTSLATIVISIIATRPKVTKGDFSREDVMHAKTNLLFFGNFYKTTLDEYRWGMSTMMRDPNYLYGALIDDIYYLGAVLGKKYRLLSIAYNIFMIGLIVSVIAFSLAILLHNPDKSLNIQDASGNPF